jgi:hypothetical protein
MSGAPSRPLSGTPPPEAAPEVFRPRIWLRYSVLVAIAFWLFMFFCLVALHSSTQQGFLGVAFFITLFSVLGVFYNNTSIEVTGDGVIVRGVTSFRLVRFADILKVDVKPGLLQTTYAVRARRGFVLFTSLFANHQRLLKIIVERANLSRSELA